MSNYYVYIISSNTGTLYIGMTNDIGRRVYEHKNKLLAGFSKKYNIDRLLYFETFSDPNSAIAREKQIKNWRREKKVKLIDANNKDWTDISSDWYG